MSNYPGKRKGRRRIVIWARLGSDTKSRQHEWTIVGSKREGDEFEARKRIELGQSQTAEFRIAPRFSDFCQNHYRPHAEGHLKGSTWKKVRKYQVATLIAHFGPIKMSELAVLDVERFKAARKVLVEASSVNNELRVFKTVLNYAKSVGVPVPALKFKMLPVRGEGRVFCWTNQEVTALFEGARKEAPDLIPIMIFMLNTGCRKGEAIAAEWTWVDFAGAMIRIPSNESWQPKNGLPREIPMGDAVKAILSGPRRSDRWLFPSSMGGRYAEFPKDAFWAARAAAKIRGVPHTTRHTYASHFLVKVPDLFLLAKVLGHSHQRVAELYTHLLPDHLSRARNAVNLMPPIQPTKKTMGRHHGS
jgi:integrase